MKRIYVFILLLILGIGICGNLDAQVNVTVGDGTLANATTGVPAPYGTYWKSFRQQFLILASELEDLGGGAGNINSLAFNVDTINNCSPMPNFTIRLKSTSQTVLSTTFEVGDYQTVFVQDGFMPTTGWNVHEFTTPFNWDGASNILVDIFSDLVTTYTQNASVFYTETGFNSSLRFQSDSAEGQSATTGTLSMNRSNIRFNMAALVVTNPPNPAIMISPVNEAQNIFGGVALRWGSGGGAPLGYKVHFGTTNPPPFVEETTETTYNPTVENETTYYWQIVPFNAIGDAQNCPIWSFTTAGQHAIIGAGDQWARMPIDFYYKCSLFETIYYPDELGFASGIITAIAFFNNFSSTTVMDKPTQIWLGTTDQTDLTGAWIPSTEMNLVFDGNVDYPAGENTVIIQLQSPYMHTPGNLVMMVKRPLDGGYFSSTDYFKCQTGTEMRTRKLMSDSIDYDPTAPSAATAVAQFPKTAFFYSGQQIENDLAAMSLTGPLSPTEGLQSNYVVTIKNNGVNTQTNYQVKLFKTGEVELASVNGPSIASLQTLQVTIPWTPAEAGAVTIWGEVVLTGDEIEQNNRTATLDLAIQPEGIQAVTIGEGNETDRMPMDYYYKNSIFETLIYEDELDFVSGTITSLAFYNNFASNNPNGATKIWMGSTDQTDLTGGWIPSTQLNLVFDGNVQYPAGANTITIPLQTPYFHTPGNLVIMVLRPMDTDWYSSSDYFLCQSRTQMRTLKLQSDGTSYDPTNPPTATATARFPKLTIFYSAEPIENDLGISNLIGNQTPSVGSSSNYVVTIRNNGSNAQNNYQVKLFKEGDIMVSSVAGPAIQSLETLQVNIPWTPDAMGQTYLYATVDLAGDEIEQNNRTQNFIVEVLEAGTTFITIGAGTSSNTTTGSPTPYGTWYRSFRQQYLWTAAELQDAGANTGFITAIAFNVDVVNNCSPMTNFTIRVKETDQTVLSTSFEPGAYTTVWNQNDFLPTAGWNVHTLNEMYHWDGTSNLLIDVFCDIIPGGYSQNASVYYTLTGGNTALRAQSDSENCSESATGSLSSNRANLRLGMILVGMASLSGTVTGPGGTPLAEVQVQFANGGHSTVTNSQGQYNIQNIMPGDYSVSFSKHGYQTQTQNISLDEDEDATLNISLATLPMVNVTGTVIASDTQSGIAGASIQLSGYENYSGNTTATGSFNIPNVYANNSYQCTIMAPGYSNYLGTITLGSANHDMGTITLDEIAYAPHSLQAEVNVTGTAVNLNWTAPDPNATQITESFESPNFPPTDWSQEITNTGGPNANGVYNSFCRVGTVPLSGSPATPTDGSFQSGLFWDSTHQDEWLITPSFNCPPGGYLRFDSHVFLGSINEDHYYVKISTDGGNSWTPLWDASAQTGGWNYYASPITVDLENYGGMQVKLAFNAVDGPDQEGLYYVWFIDNIYIGNLRTEHSPVVNINFQDEELTYRSDSKVDPSPFATNTRHPSRAQHFGLTRNEPSLPQTQQERQAPQRSLLGYKLWRFTPGQESNETAWSSLTPNVLDEPLFTDPDWQTLPNAEYRWAVKAIYTNGVSSVASFSNVLEKSEEIGLIAGVVRRINNAPIQGATVSVGAVSATTNAAGAYSLILPIGTYDVSCTATGFEPQTANDITVSPNQTTTLNFYLDAVSNEDELVPVAATELLGNYPNPFNPETVISYSLKDATPVRLEIYNSKGQRIRVLVDETQASGWYRALWNGRDDHGKPASSGIYMYRMNAGSYSASRKMVLLQ
ncbi:MAG: carboxypeptidase regulatory-like domain-containing protein [Candidatus Cloacimonadaceae bacterium]|jgi:hypothetical protein|nr:carboxypeptidase regulatory-like domain-containing protein [Candidatus Cloacimonadota bacterium]MDX9949827.1 carboxypeptidase regulatory-like domain-containing protein [Candidatus Syntrophosphaera sp.]